MKAFNSYIREIFRMPNIEARMTKRAYIAGSETLYELFFLFRSPLINLTECSTKFLLLLPLFEVILYI